ncbi:MAG: DUF4328 domain-containing protein [Phenylobacterium sp.]
MAKRYTFLDPAALSRTVVLWLYIDVVASLLFGAASILSLSDLARVPPDAPKDTPLPSDLLVGLVALLQLVVTIVVGFLILKWIYRMSRNAHAAVKGLEIRPPWAIGWFFVPIAFLWKPFQAMSEIWRASMRPEGWRTAPVPGVLRWWWGFYLVMNFLGQASFRTYLGAQTTGDLAVSGAFDVATAVLSVPLDLVFLRIVRELTRMQVVELTLGDAAPEPG